MKAKLSIQEVLTYNNELTVILPDGMDDEDLENILDDADGEFLMGFDDYSYFLKRKGIEIVESVTSFPESPDNVEVECNDYEVLEGEEDE